MRSHLSGALLLYWTVVFAGLALATVMEPGAALGNLADLLGGAGAAGEAEAGFAVSALLGSGFLLTSSLYLWALVSVAAGHAEAADVARLAFTAALLVLTVLFAVLALRPAGGVLCGTALMVAALLASYLVLGAESRDAAAAPSEPATSAARIMAADAAHTSTLRGSPLSVKPEGKS